MKPLTFILILFIIISILILSIFITIKYSDTTDDTDDVASRVEIEQYKCLTPNFYNNINYQKINNWGDTNTLVVNFLNYTQAKEIFD